MTSFNTHKIFEFINSKIQGKFRFSMNRKILTFNKVSLNSIGWRLCDTLDLAKYICKIKKLSIFHENPTLCYKLYTVALSD